MIHQSFFGASALKRVWPVVIGRALSTPKDAAAFMTTLQDEPAEVFAMICLTTKHRVIAYHEVLGDRSGRIRNRLRSVTRRVLIIGYEARLPKTRDALVKSYRKLMATTRAVLRDTATMVRWLGQRVRTPSPQVQPILQRAQDRLQEMRPLVQRVVDQTRARILGGDTPCPRLLTRGCSQPSRARHAQSTLT